MKMAVNTKNITISHQVMKAEFVRILLSNGFSKGRAEECAEIFTLNTIEGISSHGVNRFPRFVGNIKDGYVIPDAVPSLVSRAGALEQWNGNLGPGPLNATFATERVMEIAGTNGIGIIALANTNHWMRGGTYGWQAARKGFVFLGWTNTCANMPAWGGTDARLGNNPFVLAVPYYDDAVVMDFAMTQFSYGKMESYQNEGKQLPYYGGYNKKGELTTDPGEILETFRALPIGYWKGAGLSMLLDIMATVLSGGMATHDVESCQGESAISQVYIAINTRSLNNFPSISKSIDEIILDLKKSSKESSETKIRYPGENVKAIREKNIAEGMIVNKGIWEKILSL